MPKAYQHRACFGAGLASSAEDPVTRLSQDCPLWAVFGVRSQRAIDPLRWGSGQCVACQWGRNALRIGCLQAMNQYD